MPLRHCCHAFDAIIAAMPPLLLMPYAFRLPLAPAIAAAILLPSSLAIIFDIDS
jgi:hypothetical protein